MTRALGCAACLEQEPAAFLGLVDEVLQQAGSRHVLVLVCELVGFAHVLNLSLVVVHELVQHIDSRHVILVVVFDALQLGDLSDRADRGAADLAGAFSEYVDTAFQLLALFVEQEVIVAEMRPADVPVEVLRLDIECERISQQRIERRGNLADCIVRKIGRGIEPRRSCVRFELFSPCWSQHTSFLGKGHHGAPAVRVC